MPQTVSSPPRRWLILGVLLATAALLASVLQRRDEGTVAFSVGGDFRGCSQLEGEAARECYAREVGRELAAVGGAAPRAVFAAPADGSVTFTAAAADTSAALLCDLHFRVGVTEADRASWVRWNALPAQPAS